MPSPKASMKPTSPSDTHKRVRRVVAGDRKSEAVSRTTTLFASQDSRTIYYSQGGSIQTIRTRSGEHDKRKLNVPPDSKFAVCPRDSKKILVWSLTTAPVSATTSPSSPATVSPTRKFVKLVNFETGQTLMSMSEEACSGARDLCVTPDWKRVVLLDDHGVSVYRLDSGIMVGGSPRSTEASAPVFSCIAALHDNQHVALAQAERNVVMIWSLEQSKAVKTLEGPSGSEVLGHLQVSDDDRMLMGLSRGSAFFWDLEARRLVRSIDVGGREPGSSLFAPLKVSLSADWKWMTVRADFGQVIKFYEVDKGEVVASFSDHNTTMNASTLTPDLRFLVTMDYVTPDTLTTGRVYMTFWDARKILKDKWYAHRGAYHGSRSKDGRRNGHGKCFFLDKSNFDGEWVNDDRHGHGKQEYRDGSVYDGTWVEDERAGEGRSEYPDHSRYDGEWKNDGREGHGTCWFADGSRYQGAWRDDRRHGEGEHRSSLGTRYHGDWRHDQREGHGIAEYTDGSRYDGVWQRDEWHGRGVLYSADKTRYEGEFRRGKRHGHGKLFNTQGGLEYDGQWHDNLRHGHGKEFGAHGVVLYDGPWLEGVKAALHKQNAMRSLTDLLSPNRNPVEQLQLKGHGKGASSGCSWVWSLLALVFVALAAAAATAFYLRDHEVVWKGLPSMPSMPSMPSIPSFGQCDAETDEQSGACLPNGMPWEQLWR